MSLNHAQAEAVAYDRGPCMVLAGPGSGKTLTIARRIEYLIQKYKVRPEEILVITFTKYAACEMRDRFRKIAGEKGNGVTFGTFHGIYYGILKWAYGSRDFQLLKDVEKLELIRQAMQEIGWEESREAEEEKDRLKELAIEIGNVKNRGMNIEDYHPAHIPAERFASLYREYEGQKRKCGRIDFEDMLLLCRELFQKRSDLLKVWQEKFRYILVDEFQDTGTLQAEIIYMVADLRKNVCVVGDDDQSIYGFRGADSSIFKEFSRKYPGSVQIILGTNYRSLPYIIEGADKVIRNNENRIVKNMSAYRQGEGKVHIRQTASYGRQADMAVSLINDYVKTGGHLSDIAILYRVKKEASVLVNTLETIGMPFFTRDNVDDIHLGICFYDMLAYYRLSRGVPEQTDLRRIINRPKRYIRSNLVHNCEFDRNKIYEACTKNASRQDCLRINDTINDMFLDFRSLSRIDNPTQFINYIYDDMGYENDLFEYAEYTGLDSGDIINQSEAMKKEALKFDNMSEWYRYITDREYRVRTDKNEGVYLSTFHGAKGLQWKKVIIISANEQVTPYAYMGKVDDYEEERRLFYVAMTRAEDELDIIYIDGGARHQKRSRYVQELITV